MEGEEAAARVKATAVNSRTGDGGVCGPEEAESTGTRGQGEGWRVGGDEWARELGAGGIVNGCNVSGKRAGYL